MFRIRIRLDTFRETDLGSKKSAKIMKNFKKNLEKSQEYHTFLAKISNFCLTDINIYLIKKKLFWRNIFLIEKKVKKCWSDPEQDIIFAHRCCYRTGRCPMSIYYNFSICTHCCQTLINFSESRTNSHRTFDQLKF